MEMLPSGLADIVDDEEDLARFLTSSSQFNTTGIKPSAFLPSPKNGKTSVFRHGGDPRESLWLIAEKYLAGIQTIRGAAIVKAKHVRSASLDIEPKEPPPRHANIVGWPSSSTDPELGRAEQKERALLIARQAGYLPR